MNVAKRHNAARGARACPNVNSAGQRMCTTTLAGTQAAHECEHGVACKYEQDEAGNVTDWHRSNCDACNERLAREAAAA